MIRDGREARMSNVKNEENKENKELAMDADKKRSGSSKWLSGLLIAGAFLAGFGTSTITNNISNTSKASVDIRSEGIGEELKDVELGMTLEDVKKVVDLDNEKIILDEFEDEFGDGIVLSIDKALGERESHRDYVVLIDGEVERTYEMISVKEADAKPVVSQLLEELSEDYGKYDVTSSFYVEDEDGSGYMTEYTWQEDGFARSVIVSAPREGMINIINDTFTIDSIEEDSTKLTEEADTKNESVENAHE